MFLRLRRISIHPIASARLYWMHGLPSSEKGAVGGLVTLHARRAVPWVSLSIAEWGTGIYILIMVSNGDQIKVGDLFLFLDIIVHPPARCRALLTLSVVSRRTCSTCLARSWIGMGALGGLLRRSRRIR